MEYTVRLSRDSLSSPWGFRMQGGADLRTQLIVQRVFSGSPAEGELQRGDIILSINNRESADLSHSAAEHLIKTAGGELSLRVKRTAQNYSLPHTDFDSKQLNNDMWRQPGYQATYGTDYYNPASAGSKLAPKDQAMLHLVSHSLAQKSAASGPNVMSPRHSGGYYDEPNNQQHYGWVPAQTPSNPYSNQPPRKSYQPQNFNRPTPGLSAYRPAKNPYNSTAQAAHLQYNSPLGLYSTKNAQNALNTSVPGDSAAAQTIKAQINSGAAARAAAENKARLSSYQGGEAKGDIVDSPTLRYVLREDEVKAKTGHNPDMRFYKGVREYGPGKVPLKAYKEDIDDAIPSSDF